MSDQYAWDVCCNHMHLALRDNAAGFQVVDGKRYTFLSTALSSSHAIAYCPWCGKLAHEEVDYKDITVGPRIEELANNYRSRAHEMESVLERHRKGEAHGS